ncbi:hypothetical protein QM480_02970 [Flectobacillus sp. DC10W]|jgi:sensor domain CHASE-containing protein|uniref:Uncharacterized protein n=1 Tax=Flectobacillus longus TaxID=2984207 RepID=A0ABT6YI43_9BACT|nr:hypothetical protein [Flectobacillus longus]MDI9863270.1 hypothetical protein [Flectobacillus longus]
MQLKLITKLEKAAPQRTPFSVIVLSAFLLLSVIINILLGISSNSCSQQSAHNKVLNDSIITQKNQLQEQLNGFVQNSQGSTSHQ